MYDHYIEAFGKIVRNPSLQVTLEEYIEGHPIDETSEECSDLLRKSGHFGALEAVHEVFFERKDHKKNVVWL